MENKFIRLVGPDICLSSQAAEYYLKINGIWEDHLHMVRINYDMHR